MKTVEFDCIPSTNDYARAHEAEGDMIVTARRQTAGKGTKNRTFDSGEGGLYLTKLTHYADFGADRVFEIMLDTSVAVCRTMEDFGLRPSIKWPNDIYVNGKKICGILIENTFSGLSVSRSVVGIGVNINNILPDGLRSTATTMSEARGERLSVDAVRARLVGHLQEHFPVEEYRGYIFFLGQEVLLIRGEDESVVTALDIDGRGRLVVRGEDGTEYAVTAGEVSLRFTR